MEFRRVLFRSYFANEGITVLDGIACQSVRKTAEGGVALAILCEGVAETIVAERLLVAPGRPPNVEDLGLGEAGVRQTPGGAIIVDDRMQTSVPGVYAPGAVTRRAQVVFMADYDVKIAANNAPHGRPTHYKQKRPRWGQRGV